MRAFTLLIPSESTLAGLVEGAVIRGSGTMGIADLRVIVVHT